METSTNQQKQNKWPLIIALCIPVLMIILVAAFVYLPGLGKRPMYNFLYMSGDNSYYYDYYGGREYQVSGEKLVYSPRPIPTPFPGSNVPVIVPDNAKPKFYVYNVATKEASEVTFQEASTYTLDSSNVSSDGYKIEQGNYRGGDFIFGAGGSDYGSWFLKGHNRSIKLNLKLSGRDYYNFQFLGWIK